MISVENLMRNSLEHSLTASAENGIQYSLGVKLSTILPKPFFLRIKLVSVEMMLRLPDEKLQNFKLELQGFIHRKHASKRQLQALVGWRLE